MMRGPVYLVGSGEDGLLAKLARRAQDAARGGRPLRVAVSYAPVAGDAGGLKFMSARMGRLFPGATIERFRVAGEEQGDARLGTPAVASPRVAGAESADEARAIVDRAELVFVSGGDATLGARILDESGASAWLREANARGVAMMGVSAGSIALGAWWADWHEDESGDEEDHLARTGLVRGIGAVPGHVFDTHNEEDDWDELRFVAKLCARRGETARFLGIPTGGALVFPGDGAMETVGRAPFVLGDAH